MSTATAKQVRWAERPLPVIRPKPPTTAEATYRGLRLKAEEASTPAYAFWSVRFQFGGLEASASDFGRMTFEAAKAAAIDAADRLLAAGAEAAS